MRYLPKSPADREAILKAIGARSMDDLFAPIPAEYRLNRDLKVPRQMAESEIVDWFRLRSKENGIEYTSFLGAGAYMHYRPVIIDSLISRGEFLTAYTPYQAEISQGTLQAIFEFQTMICELTGMEVANASMYDGSTAAAEAAMMAVRVTGRNSVVIAKSLHPEYREVLATYAYHQGMPLATVGYADAGRVNFKELEQAITPDTACVLIQSPNFFGTIEDVAAIAETRTQKWRAAGGFDRGGGVAGNRGAAARGRHCCHGGPVVRSPARIWRTVLRGDRHAREICPADAGTTCRADHRPQWKTRLRADPGYAGTAHPAREGDVQHLHQPGAGRADGQYLHDGLRQGGAERTGETEPGEDGLRRGPVRQTRARCCSPSAPRFNEFVVQTGEDPYAINSRLLGHKMVGGLPLRKFYPELGNAALWCCTELTTRTAIDTAVGMVAESEARCESAKTQWKRWRDEARDPQSHPPRQSE